MVIFKGEGLSGSVSCSSTYCISIAVLVVLSGKGSFVLSYELVTDCPGL